MKMNGESTMAEIKNQVQYRSINDLKELPGNPRIIKKDQFEKLKQSIKDNADYFEARPIILSDRTGELVILAGNQRYKAAKALGMTEVPTVLLPDLTEEREREIVIRDNVSNGDWDMDALANEWDEAQLQEWGVDITWQEPEAPLAEEGLLDEDVLPQSFKAEPIDKFEASLSVSIPDEQRFEKLKRMAVECKNEELKQILEMRLKDFELFNFDYIANYYLGGASKDERELLEEFGLVIATEKRALELGYLEIERSVMLGGPRR